MPTKYETFAELSARTEKLLTDSTENNAFSEEAAEIPEIPVEEPRRSYPSSHFWLLHCRNPADCAYSVRSLSFYSPSGNTSFLISKCVSKASCAWVKRVRSAC